MRERDALNLACLIIERCVLNLVFSRDASVSINCQRISPVFRGASLLQFIVTVWQAKSLEFFWLGDRKHKGVGGWGPHLDVCLVIRTYPPRKAGAGGGKIKSTPSPHS